MKSPAWIINRAFAAFAVVAVPYTVGDATQRWDAVPNVVGVAVRSDVTQYLVGMYQVVFVAVLIGILAVLWTLAEPTVRRVRVAIGGSQ